MCKDSLMGSLWVVIMILHTVFCWPVFRGERCWNHLCLEWVQWREIGSLSQEWMLALVDVLYLRTAAIWGWTRLSLICVCIANLVRRVPKFEFRHVLMPSPPLNRSSFHRRATGWWHIKTPWSVSEKVDYYKTYTFHPNLNFGRWGIKSPHDLSLYCDIWA